MPNPIDIKKLLKELYDHLDFNGVRRELNSLQAPIRRFTRILGNARDAKKNKKKLTKKQRSCLRCWYHLKKIEHFSSHHKKICKFMKEKHLNNDSCDFCIEHQKLNYVQKLHSKMRKSHEGSSASTPRQPSVSTSDESEDSTFEETEDSTSGQPTAFEQHNADFNDDYYIPEMDYQVKTAETMQ
jgi:hypothetical protein